MGTLGQCLGVADHIARSNAAGGIATRIDRTSIWKNLLGRIMPFSVSRIDLVLSCGAAGERRARRALRSCPSAIWAHIEIPDQNRPDGPGLAFISNHDWRPEYGLRSTYRRIDGVPHRISHEYLAAARPGARKRLCLGDGKLSAVLLGGPNPAFAFDDQVIARMRAVVLAEAANSMVLVTESRRSDPLLVRALRDLQNVNVRFLADDPTFSYPEMLAAADSVLVSEDSISMTCEALTTGKPVRLLELMAIPGDRLEKFRRFQTHFIEELGILSFYGDLQADISVRNVSLNDTAFVARQILEKLGR
ncbi:MAG: mitochondrial fission ELM1 family protein [Pseudaminobacter sp.]|nr:mitochondrial fission ELM1 family protein [Pseudaminobacter sp.]